MNKLKIVFLTLSFVSIQALAADFPGVDEGDEQGEDYTSAQIHISDRNYDAEPAAEVQGYSHEALDLTAHSRQSIDFEYWAGKALAVGLGAAIGYITKSLHNDYKGTAHRTVGGKEVGKNLFKYALVFGSGAVISPIVLDEDSEIEKKDVALVAAAAATVFGGMHYYENRAQAPKQDKAIAVAQAK